MSESKEPLMIQQQLQRDILKALNHQITKIGTRFNCVVDGINLDKEKPLDLFKEITTALYRIESIDKLSTALLMITLPEATSAINDWQKTKALCQSVIESVEGMERNL